MSFNSISSQLGQCNESAYMEAQFASIKSKPDPKNWIGLTFYHKFFLNKTPVSFYPEVAKLLFGVSHR
jgi:hypothetical protein